jgi:hypothetical protein
MALYNEIVEAAKNKGFQFETYTSFSDRWGEHVLPVTVLSIKLEDHVWYHWDVLPEYYNRFDMFFNGRYNQVNGATQKTFKKEYKAFKLLGIN